MVASAGEEASLGDVAINLATVCAEVGQRVVLMSTAGLASPDVNAELPQPTPMWWKHWPSPGQSAVPAIDKERANLLNGPLNPADVEHLFGETGIQGVLRLDLRYFVGHPAQVVIRVPEVLAALRQIVDVVFLEVPSYLSVHHGEGLTPLADVVLVVAERDSTRLDEMRRIKSVLKRLEAPVVGLALTEGRVEIYNWGRGDVDFETADDEASQEPDPTEQIPPVGPTKSVSSLSFDELAVAEHTPREA